MKNSTIEWTDHTFNAWEGCTKVSPGCANCYAESRNQRFHDGKNWGPGAPRLLRSDAYWKEPLKWNKESPAFVQCSLCGRREVREWDGIGFKCCSTPGCLALPETEADRVRPRVFCSSLADWLDEEGPVDQLARLLKLIHDTPNLDWLLLSKRPQNWHDRLLAAIRYNEENQGDLEVHRWMVAWISAGSIPPVNVWIGTTVEDQQRADERIPELLKIPAKVRFLSCEPLLGPVLPPLRKVKHDLKCECKGTGFVGDNGPGIRGNEEYMPCDASQPEIHWVICGGESGTKARPMHPDWARSLRDQCHAADAPFFFKQWGEWGPLEGSGAGLPTPIQFWRGGEWLNGITTEDTAHVVRIGKKAAGRLLDGREWNEFPEVKT